MALTSERFEALLRSLDEHTFRARYVKKLYLECWDFEDEIADMIYRILRHTK